MTKGLINTLIFTTGTVFGLFVGMSISKEKERKRADEEIKSVKETLKWKYEKEHPSKEQTKDDFVSDILKRHSASEKPLKVRRKEPTINYNKISTPGNTTNDSEEDAAAECENIPVGGDEVPYVIPPEEFGDIDGYDQKELTYFSDKYLIDTEDGSLIENVDEVIGLASLTTFGVYEDDSVFVRNDLLRCDYEILADERTYDEYLDTRPHSSRGSR